MNYQQFQKQLELISGLNDWKYYEGGPESSYFRAMRSNDQFRVVYSASEYRYDWTAARTHETMKFEKDCFSLKDAIDFLNMPIVINEPKRSEDLRFVSAIGFVLIGIAIGWISAIATVQIQPSCLHSSVMERT